MSDGSRWTLALCIWAVIAVVIVAAICARRLWRHLYDTDCDRAERRGHDKENDT